LNAAGEAYTELSEPVQYRLIRAVVDALPLRHYAPLVGRPGFIQVAQELVGELKAARIWPADATVAAMGDSPGCANWLKFTPLTRRGQPGLGRPAELGWPSSWRRAPQAARDWPLWWWTASTAPRQLALLEALAGRVGELIIT
jgi:hypothetical protein